MSETEKEKSPEELVNGGEWEVEPIYFGEQRGKLYRSRSTTELECYLSHEGVTYRPGDTIYMDTSTDAYLIGTICGFKQTKRDVLLSVTRFYRPEEVPEDSVSIMAAERGEGGESTLTPREIFSSDNTCTHSIQLLRGHCKIHHVKDIAESRTLDLSLEDTFFSCVVYNQESTRLASHNGEIRVGPSHQARLPPEATCSVGEEADRDELLWRPGQISPENEDKYLKLARTFRLVLLENDNIHEAEKGSRCRDLLLNDAIMTLHQCSYSFTEAIKVMNSNDTLFHEGTHFMTLEDTKKFGKGIKTIGKNFSRIKAELLTNHDREELVSFYYLWKKSPDAIKPKPLNNRSRAAAGLRRGKKDKDKNSRPPSREFADYASASEGEMENFDENKRLQYACHHCYGRESRDWHHAGREPMLLCTDCRLYYKKYGVMRSVERPETAPACLFKRSCSEEEEEAGVRTRAGKEKKENGRKRSPSYGEEGGGGTGGGGGSVNGEEEKERKQRRISNGKRKKSVGEKNGKRRKEESIKEEEDGEGEGEDDKKSSSVSPTPSGENGKEKKEEEEEEGKEANGTSGENGVKREEGGNRESEEVIILNGDVDDEKEGEAADENEPVEECNEALTEIYPCSTLYRAVKRAKGDNSCSRTDIIFTATPDNVATRQQRTVEAKKEQKLMKEAEEKKRAEEKAKQHTVTVQNGVNGQSGIQAGPSNIVHPMPRMPTQPLMPTDMSAFLQHIARQPLPNGLPAPAQFAFDPRQLAFMNQQQMAAAMMEQNQQMAAKQQMEAMMRRHGVPAVPPSPFLNGLNGGALFNGMPLNGLSPHMVAALQQQGQHDPLAFARQQQLHQMMAGMGQTAAPPQQQQDQESVMRMHEFMQNMQAMMQQGAAPAPPAAPPAAPVHPQFSQEALQQLMATMNGMNSNDMMRRLHQDSFKP